MKYGKKINSSFMVFKKLRREKNKNIMYIGDKTGDFKCSIINERGTIKPNTEEAFIVHYADYVNANMNKIYQVKRDGEENSWTQYDIRIEGKLYI